MTKATEMNHEVNAEIYPNLAAYVASGGELRVKCSGGIWYVTVVRGDEKRDLSVTMASRDLAYGLRQADMASRSWGDGVSGNENGASRRSLAQTDAAWREQDRLAQAAGQTWAEWARARLRLGCIECLRLDAYCFDCRKAADRS